METPKQALAKRLFITHPFGGNLQVNTQPIEKRDSGDGSTLVVHSIFYTLQGEGPFCGCPAIFIRLAGCNLRCPSCDTDYTSDVERMSIAEIANEVASKKMLYKLVVITGGEPFRQNISPLCKLLLDTIDCTVQIETNGTLAPSPDFPKDVVIVCSPKTGKVHPEIEARAVAYKYVMAHDSMRADGLPHFALGHGAFPHVARPNPLYPRIVYLQPMDAQDPMENAANLKAVVDSCLEHGHVLQLQVHKLVNLE